MRRAGDPESGLDSAAAWAVRPFSQPALYPAVRRTLLRLTADRTRFGITPGEGWAGRRPVDRADRLERLEPRRARSSAQRGAAPARRRCARAATPAGALPERVDARTGIPRSTTPLAWSHAFAILALRELWP